MSDVVLSAEVHFEALREPVWSRFKARHGLYPRDRFEDAYAEWWTRELERAAAGRPSRAGAPAAFVTEAVHRVLIDDARARARGLARDQKAALELVDIADQHDVAGSGDTAATAHYEAVVHRVLHLVRDRLTARELSVFVLSYLHLATTERTAAALGLSEPRVKKDRQKAMAKVGAEVWQVLSAELAPCAAYDDKALPAVFELMTTHAEDCPECSQALGGIRRSAVAAVAPVELLLLADQHSLTFIDAVVAKLTAPLHRAVELSVSAPPGGRVAAAATVAVAAAVGGSAAVKGTADAQPVRERVATLRNVATAAPVAAVRPLRTPAGTRTPEATRRTARPSSGQRSPERGKRPSGGTAPAPVPTATPAAVTTPPPAPVATTVAAPAPPPPPPAAPPTSSEFGFEKR